MRQAYSKPMRFKLVFVHADWLVAAFRKPQISVEPDACLVLNTFHIPGLPGDAQVIAVHWDYSRAGWLVMLEHPDWPEVLQGQLIPVIEESFNPIVIAERYMPAPSSWRDHPPQL